MNEKRYLKGYQKVAYGLGDFGGNFCYTFVASFVLLYLSDTVGLNPAVVGTLMMVSKIFDGFTDVVFGTLLDRFHFKSGKAKPWLYMSFIPMGVTVLLEFIIPDMNQTLQYAYFFVIYTLMNSIFFTIYSIAYNTLTALVTKNNTERVQLGVWRYVFALAAALGISIATPIMVTAFGGGAPAWRTIAIIYSLILLVACFLATVSAKELPPEELYDVDTGNTNTEDEAGIIDNFKYLFTNKYFLLLLAINISNNLMNSVANTVGSYYSIYILQNFNIYGLFSMAGMLPMIIGLLFTPIFVKKFGMYKTNVVSLIIAVCLGIPYIFIGWQKMVVPMLALMAIRGLFTSPITGTLNAITASATRNAYLTTGRKVEGSMFACTSMGMKIGSGVGVALTGWLLSLAHYDGTAAVQVDSANLMITIMYLIFPVVSILLQLIFVSGLNVEKENAELEARTQQS